jgi:hypothetical protein
MKETYATCPLRMPLWTWRCDPTFLKFTGGERDSASRLDHFGARYDRRVQKTLLSGHAGLALPVVHGPIQPAVDGQVGSLIGVLK